MDITPFIPKEKLLINRYGNGGFIINEAPYKSSVIIFADKVIEWPIKELKDLAIESLKMIFESEPRPELVLIGTGKQFLPLAPNLRAIFREYSIAVDSMNTGAACRTYDVLLSEERHVVAALIAI
jgi:uncharacterized protein